jgi:hypothetical protein
VITRTQLPASSALLMTCSNTETDLSLRASDSKSMIFLLSPCDRNCPTRERAVSMVLLVTELAVALCRWSSKDSKLRAPMAGFRAASISSLTASSLRSFCNLASASAILCDLTPSFLACSMAAASVELRLSPLFTAAANVAAPLRCFKLLSNVQPASKLSALSRLDSSKADSRADMIDVTINA